MMVLLIAEVKSGLPVSDFGEEHRVHMAAKRHEGHKAASISAWTLLERALRRMGYENMPEVCFLKNGKPVFKDADVHFSISHSGRLAAAMVSDENCAVDVECCGRKIDEKLKERCMHENEITAGMDFFEVWTKKECIGKFSGKGMPSRPHETDLTAYDKAFFCKRIFDSEGTEYFLSTLGNEQVELEWVEI